jgi:hypothetical protein
MTLMLWSGGPVMAGSGGAGVEAGGSGTPGFHDRCDLAKQLPGIRLEYRSTVEN